MPIRLSDRYEFVRVLGRGGMGTVILAEDRRLGRRVAVKVILPSVVSLPSAVERFAREAQAMAAVEHPNLVRLLDVELDQESPFFVMELVEGWTLEELVGRPRNRPAAACRRMPEARVVTLGREIGGALVALHEKGLLHRDLKPSNVMLRAATGSSVLMDLGLVRLQGGTVLTETGAVVGSPKFLPPEVASGGPWGPSSDQFQLAALLREALSGAHHLSSESLGQHFLRLQEGRWTPMPEDSEALDPRLLAVIERGMTVDPRARYQTLAAFVEALDGLDGVPPDAREEVPLTVPEPFPILRPKPPRRRGQRLLRGTVGLVLAGLLAFAWSSDPPVDRGPGDPAPISSEASPLAPGVRYAAGGALAVAVETLDPAQLWWARTPGERLLLLPGLHEVPLPSWSPPWELGWNGARARGKWSLAPKGIARGTIAHLMARGSVAGLEEIRSWRPPARGEHPGPGEAARQAWRPYLPRLPQLLAGPAPRPERLRLWHRWQTLRRSADQVAFRRGNPTSLRLPREATGAYYRGKPLAGRARLRPPLTPQGWTFKEDQLPGHLLIPSGTVGLAEARQLRFAWPGTPRDGRPVSVTLKVWLLSDACLVRVVPGDTGVGLELAFHSFPEPVGALGPLDSNYRIRHYTSSFPGDLAPLEGTPMSIELRDFAGEYRPFVRIEHLEFWWPDA